MLEQSLPLETIEQLINQRITQAFLDGQESGRRIERRIHAFNAKQEADRNRHFDDVREDAVQKVLQDMLSELPCHKNGLQFGKCPKRYIADFVVDKYQSTFTERLDSELRRLYDEKSLLEE